MSRARQACAWSLAREGDPFFQELQEVYEELGEPAVHSWPRPGELPDERAEIAATGLFDPVAVRHFDAERPGSAGQRRTAWSV